MKLNHALIAFVAFAGIVLLVAPPARAQVNDQAGFFSADAVRRADEIIADAQRRSGRKIVVETFPTFPADRRASYSKERERQFYQAWIEERGKATDSDVHVLIVRDPSHLEVGSSSDSRRGDFTAADHQATSRAMLERFRARQFDQGLLEAVQTIAAKVARSDAARSPVEQSRTGGAAPAPAPDVPPHVPPPSGDAPRTGSGGIPGGGVCGMGGGIGGLLCMVIAALAVITIVRGFARRRAAAAAGGYGQRGMYDPRTGQPYDPRYGGPAPTGGGGGLGGGLMGGILGGVLGGAAYDHLRGRGNEAQAGPLDPGAAAPPPAPMDDVSSGGDFGAGSDFSSGGDFGGGGDVSSGGDF